MIGRIVRLQADQSRINHCSASGSAAMDVTQLPFNRLIELEPAEADSGFLVCRPDAPQYTTHLGPAHAAALLAVAEAGSAALLLRHMGGATAGFVPVV